MDIAHGKTSMRNAVLRVGGGRGFIVNYRAHFGHPKPVVITAAHCLPKKLPPPHPARYLEEATYRRLLGPLAGKRTVWAECLFVDPVADIAVLGQPDDQALSEEADAYNELVAGLTPLMVADAPKQGVELLTLPGFGGDGAVARRPLARGPRGALRRAPGV
jgi:hypothetical protein